LEKKHLRPDQPRGGARSKISSTLKSGCKYNTFGIWKSGEGEGDAENSAVWFDPLQVQQVRDVGSC
jgi:hypothetical protein